MNLKNQTIKKTSSFKIWNISFKKRRNNLKEGSLHLNIKLMNLKKSTNQRRKHWFKKKKRYKGCSKKKSK